MSLDADIDIDLRIGRFRIVGPLPGRGGPWLLEHCFAAMLAAIEDVVGEVHHEAPEFVHARARAGGCWTSSCKLRLLRKFACPLHQLPM